MPSLRRTFSSPTVRSSPYPSYGLSSSLSAARAQSSHAHGYRRSSGSETTNRRVLADIEWWRVADGQLVDLGSDVGRRTLEVLTPRDQERRTGHEQQGSAPTASAEPEYDYTPWLSSPLFTATEDASPLPTDQFAALSISPHTPTPELDSASSSLLSSPESALSPLEDLSLDIPVRKVTSPSRRRKRVVTAPVFPSKKQLIDDFLFCDVNGYQPFGPYADFSISPLSSHSPMLLN
ncbi:hypothetical protein AMATHDRAFT_46907 [Amanita thiersii Skay4041]|uniref:Uncharacterized protein n=1 Tax=Amanita thiersii Skay4041 TaxID=703135 RepID=A0A2A9NVJ4_9AGAR|nr:hypothetical protein AMATHDRAFT_46907 [Amanita thiersii Skay4041]